MRQDRLARRVAASYMRTLFTFRTDIEDLEGFPTHVTRQLEDASEERIPGTYEEHPNEPVYVVTDGIGFMSPVVPEDAIRR